MVEQTPGIGNKEEESCLGSQDAKSLSRGAAVCNQAEGQGQRHATYAQLLRGETAWRGCPRAHRTPTSNHAPPPVSQAWGLLCCHPSYPLMAPYWSERTSTSLQDPYHHPTVLIVQRTSHLVHYLRNIPYIPLPLKGHPKGLQGGDPFFSKWDMPYTLGSETRCPRLLVAQIGCQTSHTLPDDVPHPLDGTSLFLCGCGPLFPH